MHIVLNLQRRLIFTWFLLFSVHMMVSRAQTFDFGSIFTKLINRNKPKDRFCVASRSPAEIVRDMQITDQGCISQFRYLTPQRRIQLGERLHYCACDERVAENNDKVIGSITGLVSGDFDFANLIPSLSQSCQDIVNKMLCRLVNESRPKQYCNICSFIKVALHPRDILECTCAIHVGPVTEDRLRATMYNCLMRYPLRVSEARELGALDNGARCKTVSEDVWRV